MNWAREIFVRQFADLPREERSRVALLSLFFFLVIATYWVLKPLKRGLLINHFGDEPLRLLGFTFGGAEAEQIGKVLNMFGAFLLVILFTWLARRSHRLLLLITLPSLFAAGLLYFAAVIGPPNTDAVVWAFYVFGDMFNTAMVALFWAFTDDITTTDGASRTYGLIGLGGVIGGFTGATLVNTLVRDMQRGPLLLFCLIPMAAVIAIGFVVDRMARRAPPKVLHYDGPSSTGHFSAATEGARLVFGSGYLLGIAGIIACYELVSNIVDYQLAATVERLLPGNLAKDMFFARVGQIIGIGSIAVQLLLTGVIMRRFGEQVALLVLPVAMAAASAGFFVLPVLAFAAAMSTSDNALNYSIQQSAKEALYTPTPFDITYKAKAFIDMFVQRSAKVVSVFANLAFAAFAGAGVRWLSLLSLAVLGVWIALVLAVSFRFRRAAE